MCLVSRCVVMAVSWLDGCEETTYGAIDAPIHSIALIILTEQLHFISFCQRLLK